VSLARAAASGCSHRFRIRGDIDRECRRHRLALRVQLLLLGQDAIAVFLGRELAGHPFAGVDTQAGAIDILVVDALDKAAFAIRNQLDVALGLVSDR
jgi:hypothetical protein